MRTVLAFLSSSLATAALVVAVMLGFHLQSPPDTQNPRRDWKDRQALCAAPDEKRAAAPCELLQDE